MTDNLKLNLELTVDGASRQVDIDKIAATAARAGAAADCRRFLLDAGLGAPARLF